MKNRILLTLAVSFCLLLFCCGCTAAEQKPSFCKWAGPHDPYTDAVMRAVPDFREAERSESFSVLRSGGALECFDAQAIPAIEDGVGKYWYPQCLATVVIAIDRAQTNVRVCSWHELFEAGEPVSWNSEEVLTLAALYYGLEGAQYTKAQGLSLLESQHLRHEFFRNCWDTPLMVCFDFQAAALIAEGRLLEIVVPEDGTFSYTLGLLSNQLLAVPSDEDLLAAGLRLPDGRCTDPACAELDYRSAAPVEDFDHLLEVTECTRSSIRRQVQHTRLYSSADECESILVAVIGVVLVLVWMGSAMHRSIRPDIQRAICLCAMLIAGWLLLRLFKYQLDQFSPLNRYCWYGFYIFQLAIPLVMLFIAAVIDRPDGGGKLPRWLWPILGLYPVMVALVFTNDFHGLVFHLDLSINWNDNYSYGWGYYVIYGYSVLVFLQSLVLLVKKSWKSPKWLGRLLPPILGLLIIGYATAYNQGIPLARDSDFTVTFCLLAVLFFEAALQTGLIPSNTCYRLLFNSSALEIQLLDHNGKTILPEISALPLDPVLREQLRSRSDISIQQGEDTVLYGHAVHGGTVVWRKDLSQIHHLHREVQASVERLEAANALLRSEGKIHHQRVAAEVKAELFTSLGREIETRTEELSGCIRQLPQAEDRSRQIAYITLLLCYIKRRCNLFFLAQEGNKLAADELAIYLNELSEFAGYAGIHALVRCGVSNTMALRTATLCYDFYFEALGWSVRQSHATLVGQLEESDASLDFRILSSEEAETSLFSATFLQAAKDANGAVECRALEETTGIYLTFPKGGAGNE